MSSSEDLQNNDVSDEAGDNEVVAMDTTDTVMTTNSETTSVWDVARENSSKMVLQSVLDDMENKAAKQKEEVQQYRRRAEWIRRQHLLLPCTCHNHSSNRIPRFDFRTESWGWCS